MLTSTPDSSPQYSTEQMGDPRLLVLRAVRARLSDPSKWARGTMCRDSKGRPTHRGSETAAAWDLLGALFLEGERLGRGLVGAFNLLKAVLGPWETIGRFNDTTTHEGLLDLIDSAIDLALRQAPTDKEQL